MDKTTLAGKNRIPESQNTEQPTVFDGFTLDEIRHHRALIAVRKEFAKAKFYEKVDGVKQVTPFVNKGTGKLKTVGQIGSIPLKLMKGLNYTDYILLGLSTFSTVKKVCSLFRKKKR